MTNEELFWNYKMLGHVFEMGIFSNIWMTEIVGAFQWLM